ncbi:cytidine deaminase, partial [Vibrio cholerae]|nr:cytidine deaminase [Vibrio cholerae]
LEPLRRKAFIISSLKHPEEVQKLRTIYSRGFYLIGIHSSEISRRDFLIANKGMSENEANLLIKRDADESDKHGQHTRDTYHLSDFFIDYGSNRHKAQYDIWRTLDLMFGKPFVTPTFDEFAMFMAFSSSLRSADLSRQVGAVMTKNKNIIATGANDIPQAGGGLYWPDYDSKGEKIVDKE